MERVLGIELELLQDNVPIYASKVEFTMPPESICSAAVMHTTTTERERQAIERTEI